jgi:hypothetical protein
MGSMSSKRRHAYRDLGIPHIHTVVYFRNHHFGGAPWIIIDRFFAEMY